MRIPITFLVLLAGAAFAEEATAPGTGRHSCLLRAFPLEAAAYQPEVAELVKAGVPQRYGEEEWSAIVLTHEFHQHVGIYTMLGAKMAVRARELLEAPFRAVQVKVDCGRKQPLACFTDGIQAGLASTVGQGLIDVPETEAPQVSASFTYKGQTLRLKLKPEYAAEIAKHIQAAIAEHGNLTPAYFEAVEKAAYAFWAEFDRREIFEVDQNAPAPSQNQPG